MKGGVRAYIERIVVIYGLLKARSHLLFSAYEGCDGVVNHHCRLVFEAERPEVADCHSFDALPVEPFLLEQLDCGGVDALRFHPLRADEERREE